MEENIGEGEEAAVQPLVTKYLVLTLLEPEAKM